MRWHPQLGRGAGIVTSLLALGSSILRHNKAAGISLLLLQIIHSHETLLILLLLIWPLLWAMSMMESWFKALQHVNHVTSPNAVAAFEMTATAVLTEQCG